MNPLRKQMDDAMVLRGLADRTREAYLWQVAQLAKYYHCGPDRLDAAQVQRYLLHLLQERGLAWSSCNQACHALRFFYHVTQHRPEVAIEIPRLRQPQKLPEVLSREEVARLFDVTPNLKHRALLMTTYAAGLRVSEVVALRLTDIDSSRMTLRVEQGKGAKDRYTLLSPRLLDQLREYWHAFHPRHWLFPAQRADGHTDSGTAQKMYYAAKRRAGIAKRGGIHSLRHAFATHLLEAAVDVYTIQRLMGHGKLSTTARYFHLAHGGLSTIAKTKDLLQRP